MPIAPKLDARAGLPANESALPPGRRTRPRAGSSHHRSARMVEPRDRTGVPGDGLPHAPPLGHADHLRVSSKLPK